MLKGNNSDEKSYIQECSVCVCDVLWIQCLHKSHHHLLDTQNHTDPHCPLYHDHCIKGDNRKQKRKIKTEEGGNSGKLNRKAGRYISWQKWLFSRNDFYVRLSTTLPFFDEIYVVYVTGSSCGRFLDLLVSRIKIWRIPTNSQAAYTCLYMFKNHLHWTTN